MALAVAAIAALTIVCVVLLRALISERREADKRADLLMTRIQAPQLAPALVSLPDTEDAPQWQSEQEQERVWAEANGTEFMERIEGLNGTS